MIHGGFTWIPSFTVFALATTTTSPWWARHHALGWVSIAVSGVCPGLGWVSPINHPPIIWQYLGINHPQMVGLYGIGFITYSYIYLLQWHIHVHPFHPYLYYLGIVGKRVWPLHSKLFFQWCFSLNKVTKDLNWTWHTSPGTVPGLIHRSYPWLLDDFIIEVRSKEHQPSQSWEGCTLGCSFLVSVEHSWKNLPRSIGPCDSWSIPTCWSLATGWALILSWGFRPRRVGIWILISDSFRLFLDLSQSFMTVSHSWPGPCLLCYFMCIIVINCIHILYIIIDRSKGPCEEFSLRRPFMFCWEPLRKFFASSWKFFFAKVSRKLDIMNH